MGMNFTTLISTDALASHLDDPAVAIVDCRFKLDDVEWGEKEYVASHVPGAVYASLDRDLSGAKTGVNGRHPLPHSAALGATLGRFGIDRGVQVVAYDQDNGMFASRLWWLLRWLGHDAVAVLDGGFKQWTAERRAVRSGAESRAPRVFDVHTRSEMTLDVNAVASHIGANDWRLVDARAPQRYRGEVEPIDRTPGHIPGATNRFFGQNLGADGTFLAPEALRASFKDALGVAPDHLVCYCGSGVTACHNLLALEHAGITGAKLYAGSWSEWSADPSRPTEKS